MGTVPGDQDQAAEGLSGRPQRWDRSEEGRGRSTAPVDPRGPRESISGPGSSSAPSTPDGRSGVGLQPGSRCGTSPPQPRQAAPGLSHTQSVFWQGPGHLAECSTADGPPARVPPKVLTREPNPSERQDTSFPFYRGPTSARPQTPSTHHLLGLDRVTAEPEPPPLGVQLQNGHLRPQARPLLKWDARSLPRLCRENSFGCTALLASGVSPGAPPTTQATPAHQVCLQ